MIRKRSRFVEIREKGSSVYSRYFILLEDSGSGLLGITLTKKVGNAVVRNRLRRRVKEILRHHLKQIKADVDQVLIVKRGASKSTFQALQHDLLQLLGKSKGCLL